MHAYYCPTPWEPPGALRPSGGMASSVCMSTCQTEDCLGMSRTGYAAAGASVPPLSVTILTRLPRRHGPGMMPAVWADT